MNNPIFKFTKLILCAVALSCSASPLSAAAGAAAVYDAAANVALRSIARTGSVTAQKNALMYTQTLAQAQTLIRMEKMIRSGDWKYMSPTEMSRMISRMPGMGSFNIGSMFPSSGYLDIFMGMSPSDVTNVVNNPRSIVSRRLFRKVVGDLGAASSRTGGLNAAEIMFAARMAASRDKPYAPGMIEDIGDFTIARQIASAEDDAKRQAALAKTAASVQKRQQEAAADGTTDLNKGIAANNELTGLAVSAQLEANRIAINQNAAVMTQTAAENEAARKQLIIETARRIYESPNK